MFKKLSDSYYSDKNFFLAVLGVIIGVLGLLLAILFFGVEKIGIKSCIIIILILLSLIIFLVAYIKIIQKKKRIFLSYNDIHQKKIICGFTNYPPLFFEETYDSKIVRKGFAHAILTQIFAKCTNEIEYKKFPTWEDCLQAIRNGKIHVISSPVFETSSRLKKYDIQCTSPLFFSEMEIRIKKGSNLAYDAETCEGFSLTDALAKLHSLKYEGVYVQGEISEGFIKKYKFSKSKKIEAEQNLPYVSALNEIITSDNPLFIFMANDKVLSAMDTMTKEDQDKTINILKPHACTYPLCFAVEKNEIVLKHFLEEKLYYLRHTIDNKELNTELEFSPNYLDQTIERSGIRHFIYSSQEKLTTKTSHLFDFDVKSFNVTPDEYNCYTDLAYNQLFIEYQRKITEILSTYVDDLKKENSENIHLKILEIGFGTGNTTKIILETLDCHSNLKLEIDSIDNDPQMKRKIENDKLPDKFWGRAVVIFHLDDVSSYLKKVKDNTYDFVISGFTLHNINKNRRSLIYENIYSSLKNNGIFINIDKYVPEKPEEQIDALQEIMTNYINHSLFPKEPNLHFLKKILKHYITDFNEEKKMNLLTEEKCLIKQNFSIKDRDATQLKHFMGRIVAQKIPI